MKRYELVECFSQSDSCDAHMEEDENGDWVLIDDALAMTAAKNKALGALRTIYDGEWPDPPLRDLIAELEAGK